MLNRFCQWRENSRDGVETWIFRLPLQNYKLKSQRDLQVHNSSTMKNNLDLYHHNRPTDAALPTYQSGRCRLDACACFLYKKYSSARASTWHIFVQIWGKQPHIDLVWMYCTSEWVYTPNITVMQNPAQFYFAIIFIICNYSSHGLWIWWVLILVTLL